MQSKQIQKPIAPPVAAENIPADLKALPRWVCWRYTFVDGKWTKPPVSCRTGRLIDARNPENLCCFEASDNGYHKYGTDGVGFSFLPGDQFSGIDLDDCRNPDTGEIAAAALEIIRAVNSYTEVSPSQTGVKIIVRGKLPVGRKKKGFVFAFSNGSEQQGAVEAYSDGRYFTVTGSWLPGTPPTVESRQAELEQFHAKYLGDKESKPARKKRETRPLAAAAPQVPLTDADRAVIEMASQAKDGDKFKRLWAGDVSGYDGDDSRADQALCALLAFWVGPEPERIEALFSHSALGKREKWTSRGDYRQATVAKAVEMVPSYYQGDMYIRNNRSIRSSQDCSGDCRSSQEKSGFLNTERKEKKVVSENSADLERKALQLVTELAAEEGLTEWTAPFRLARRLKSHLGGAPAQYTTAIAAFCQLTGLPFKDIEYAVADLWDQIKLQENQDVLEYAATRARREPVPLGEGFREVDILVASLVYYLGDLTKPKPAWLSQVQVGELIGLRQGSVSRIIGKLIRCGILECVNPHWLKNHRAKEYQYIGPLPAEPLKSPQINPAAQSDLRAA